MLFLKSLIILNLQDVQIFYNSVSISLWPSQSIMVSEEYRELLVPVPERPWSEMILVHTGDCDLESSSVNQSTVRI